MSTTTEAAPLAPLYAALSRAIGRASAVGKDAKNTFHGYKYASAEGLIAEARDALAAEGLAVFSSAWRLIERETEPGAAPVGYFADVGVDYVVAHADGASMVCNATTPVIREKGRPEDKALATALTYNLGYFLRGLLLLPRVDEEHDVDKRDDRDYQPQPSRGGNDQRQAGNGTRGNGAPTAAKLPDPPAKPAAKPFDMTAALAAIAAAGNVAELETAGAKMVGCPEEQRDTLKAVYRKRREELSGPPAAEAGKPAEVATIDKNWAGLLTDLAPIVDADTTAWTEDDIGSEFNAVLERAVDRNDLNVKALPWMAPANKRGGPRVKALRESLSKMFDKRAAELRPQARA